MRGGVLAAVIVSLALMVSAPLAGAAAKLPTALISSMTIASSSHATGARAVRLTVTLHYEMQCGYAGAGPLVVTFPSAVKLPKRFAAGAVQLSSKAVAATVDGQRVTVTVAPHKGVMCDVMGPGSLVLAFTPAAKLSNPTQPGSYRFTATHAKRVFAATLAVSAS